MNKKYFVKGFIIIAALIAFAFTLGYAARAVQKAALEKKYSRMSEEIQYNFIGEVKINPDIARPLKEFNYVYFSTSTGEVIEEKVIDYPVKFTFDIEKEINYFEKIYDVKLPDGVDYLDRNIYVITGSKITGFDVKGLHKDELSEFRTPAYDTSILHEEDYDANILYIYYIESSKDGYDFYFH